MERFTISKSEKQTIYEIYRACRLCGAGGGYRMPIIQNIIDLDSSEVDLRQKIQECLQLEVRPDDRMPPLICELCVDKLTDFHNFLELARQTNVKTRTRLGLPIQTPKKGEVESTDCILGVTEPVFVKEDETKKAKAGPKSKTIKKETEVDKIKIENTSDSSRSSSVSSRTGRSTRRAPSPRARRLTAPASAPAAASAPAPAPTTRRKPDKETRPLKAPETPKNVEVSKEKKGLSKELLTLIHDNIKYEDNSLLAPRSLKRTREEPPRPALLPKRANLRQPPQQSRQPPAPKEPVHPARAPSPARARPGPKSRKPAPAPEPEPLPVPLKVPRKTTPAKADISYKKYSKEDLEKALEDIQNGVLTAHRASKVYKIPNQTLRDKINKKYKKQENVSSTVLTSQEEQILVQWVLHMTEIGFPVTKDQLLQSVAKLLLELKQPNPFKNGVPGTHWYAAFLKRNPTITKRVCQTLTTARVSADEENIKGWFGRGRKYFEENNLSDVLDDPSRVFNCDESVSREPRLADTEASLATQTEPLEVRGNHKRDCVISAAVMSKEPPKPQEPPPAGPPFKCLVCDAQIKTAGAFTNHMRSHVPSFTKLANACNPCGKWFITAEEAAAHHRFHRAPTFPYHCRRCFDDFTTLQLYDDHIAKGLCVQDEPPASRATADECCAASAGDLAHKCPPRGKPGGKCAKCSKTYATSKTLKRHESQCGQRKAGDLIADPDVLRRLKPMRVRITRCDDLVARETGDHYDISAVKPNYGLAKNYIYPYMKLPVKTKPLNRDSKVAISLPLKEDLATDFIHWDSDDSDSEIIRKVPSLSTLAIKKLFSKNLLGKVPRKRRKVRNEEFEEFNDSSDINDIISSFGNMGNGTVDKDAFTAKIKDIIGCLDDSADNFDDEASKISLDADENSENRCDDKVCNMENSDSTKENTESNEHVDDNCEESSIVEASSEEPSNVEASTSNTVLDNLSKHLEDENEKVNRIETDVEPDNCKNDELDVSLLKSTEKESAADTEIENMSSIDMKNVNLGMETDSSKNDKELDVTLQKSNEKDSDAAKAREIENTSRIEMEPENLDIESNSSKNDKDLDVALEKCIENEREAGTRETEYMPINGFTHENDNLELDKSKINEDIKQTKESPIKHSIENLIGEDKNPDKYINEVISSIEDIIMNNRAGEMPHENDEANEITDSNLMDALDEEIGEKKERIGDNDKITLEDLLPKENRHEELEDISDDDFNFDA